MSTSSATVSTVACGFALTIVAVAGAALTVMAALATTEAEVEVLEALALAVAVAVCVALRITKIDCDLSMRLSVRSRIGPSVEPFLFKRCWRKIDPPSGAVRAVFFRPSEDCSKMVPSATLLLMACWNKIVLPPVEAVVTSGRVLAFSRWCCSRIGLSSSLSKLNSS
uniref:(northern house mosquito) hypothetical protein n=1 Tax=Culex pipiens TaxID=7175 RepID=A0A8D8DYD3_CULPI